MNAKTTKVARKAKPKHPLKLNAKDWDRRKTVDHICDQLATSSMGIGKILAAGYGGLPLPSYSRFMQWMDDEPVLLDLYSRAKEAQADFMADEILEIADDARNDWMDREDPDNPGFRLNSEQIQRSKLRVDTRKWLASKLKPKKYGDKLEQTHKASVVSELPREMQKAIAERLRALINS